MGTVDALMTQLEKDLATMQATLHALRAVNVVVGPVSVSAGPVDPRILSFYVLLTQNEHGQDLVATLKGTPLILPVRGEVDVDLLDELREVAGHDLGLIGKQLILARFHLREDLDVFDRRFERRSGRKTASPFG